MENYIHNYLSKFYTLSTSEESGKQIQFLITYGIYYRDDVSKTKDLIYCEYLLKEITTVFGVSEDQAVYFITRWVGTINRHADLHWYWKQKPETKLDFPNAVRVAAIAMGLDLVSVQPMSGPTGKLNYLDYRYSADTIDAPNANGRVYLEEATRKARDEYMTNQFRHSIGEIDHPNQMIGVSNRAFNG